MEPTKDLTSKEAAAYLQISYTTLVRQAQRGAIPGAYKRIATPGDPRRKPWWFTKAGLISYKSLRKAPAGSEKLANAILEVL